MTTHAARRPTTRTARRLVAPLTLAAALVLTGCGDEAVDEDLDASRAQLGAGPDAGGLLGLEVTATGEVSEVVADNAFRIDKDGLQPPGTEASDAPSPGESPGSTEPEDLDALVGLDEEDYTFGDEELGVGLEQEQTLVLVPGAVLDLTAGDRVRVSGTIRSLDAEAIEEVYEVEVDTDEYAPYLDQLVVVAADVSAVPPGGGS